MELTVSKDELSRMYTIEGMSDAQIAKVFGCDRTTIVYLRQRYGIKTKLRTGRLGELLVIDQLTQRFGESSVIDMNEMDATSSFDILLNGETRIEVKSSKRTIDKRFVFTFHNKKGSGVLVDDITSVTPYGATIKDLSKSCDFVIMVFIDVEETNFLILPSNTPGMFNRSTKSYGRKRIKEVSNHFNNWRILEGGVKWAKYLRIKKHPRQRVR